MVFDMCRSWQLTTRGEVNLPHMKLEGDGDMTPIGATKESCDTGEGQFKLFKTYKQTKISESEAAGGQIREYPADLRVRPAWR